MAPYVIIVDGCNRELVNSQRTAQRKVKRFYDKEYVGTIYGEAHYKKVNDKEAKKIREQLAIRGRKIREGLLKLIKEYKAEA